jgi:hypothetical protein
MNTFKVGDFVKNIFYVLLITSINDDNGCFKGFVIYDIRSFQNGNGIIIDNEKPIYYYNAITGLINTYYSRACNLITNEKQLELCKQAVNKFDKLSVFS